DRSVSRSVGWRRQSPYRRTVAGPGSWMLTSESGRCLRTWPCRRAGAELRAEMGMTTRSEPVPALLDRQGERAVFDGLLQGLRSGRGRALVVRGEAGVGKSALLEYVAGAAADLRVARFAGVESEMELAFAS